MKSLLLACLMLVTCPAWAGWEFVSIDAVGDRHYIDPTTVRKNGSMRLVWGLTNLAVRDKDGELSLRSRYEYDCIKERWRTISFSTHSGPDASGVVLMNSSLNDTFPWRDVPPGTVSSAKFEYVCAR
jgi:hypothetical protein